MVELISILSIGCHNNIIMVADILSSGKPDKSEDQNNACTTIKGIGPLGYIPVEHFSGRSLRLRLIR